MVKNVAIVLLACACLFLVATQQFARKNDESRPISAAEYGGLIALRDVLPAEEYRQKVLPLLQKGAEAGAVTRRQLDELGASLGSLGAQTLEAAQRLSPRDAFLKALEDAKQGAANLGGELGRSMREAMDDLSNMMNDLVKPDPSQPKPQQPGSPQPAPQSPGTDPSAPTEI